RQKQGAESPKVAPKRTRTAKSSASQPIVIDTLQPELPVRTSPRKALAFAASHATDECP
ncbi:hypothetical protein EJ02DRAFT_329985, partial [Clathrospora elynae]